MFWYTAHLLKLSHNAIFLELQKNMERCCFFLAILAGVCSFNVDVQDKTIVEFSGTNSSHFGYSVGLRTTTVDEK